MVELLDNLSALLAARKVSLDDLLLDPNNPRFSELGEELNSVAESRFAEPKVQANTFEKMRNERFDVSELRDTIKTLGFLPMDRIVVRPWKGQSDNPKYVVIEGNRRVTALRWLIQLHENGKETFSHDRLKNLQELECLVLDDEAAPASAMLERAGLAYAAMATYSRISLQPDGRLRLSPTLTLHLFPGDGRRVWVGAHDGAITLWSERDWARVLAISSRALQEAMTAARS